MHCSVVARSGAKTWVHGLPGLPVDSVEMASALLSEQVCVCADDAKESNVGHLWVRVVECHGL